MSDGEEAEGSVAERNVFMSLVSRVIRQPPYRFPGQWGRPNETSQPRIFKTLGSILRNATSEEFDAFITDFISFAQEAHAGVDTQFYIEFTNMCTNIILHWVFTHRASVDIVRTLMARTCNLMQDESNTLAIACRSFRPLCSQSGVTPLMFVAQNRQYDVLKVLLQYGMLERERWPTYIVISILFNSPRLEELNEENRGDLGREIRECVELCCRVLTSVCIPDIEMQIIYGRVPLIADWQECIPTTRYQEPCELSHLCRAVVRGCLLRKNGLPAGIKDLPLPSRLQCFLNLEL